MWWVVLCRGCREEYTVRLNPDYDMEYTCMRIGCNEKLLKVEEISSEIVNQKFNKPYDYGKMRRYNES